MCGIAGAWGSSAEHAIKPMTRSLAHRGPDGEGFWKHPDTPLHLGHRRLSIIDIDGGHQPMSIHSPDLTITYNGELYNHAELRTQLEALGHHFSSSHSDTEVLLHAYAEWGTKMVHHLNGMWAFCLVDTSRKLCFLSRDRFGQKPLYYALGNGWFAFASELTSLIRHPEVNSSTSTTGLIKFLAYGYIPAPHTYFSGVQKLPAGHNLIFQYESARLNCASYWTYLSEPDESLLHLAEGELSNRFFGLLQKSVQRRLIADVPVGTFLSGGIDSSSITSLAANSLPSGSLKTFSIGFQEQSFDESEYARSVASFLETNHHCETCSLDQSLHLLPKLIEKLDEPLGDSSLLPTFLLCQLAAQHVNVVLGGDGADELLSGYDPFRALFPARVYHTLIPAPLRPLLSALVNTLPVSHQNMSLDFKLKRTLRGLKYRPELWAPLWMAPLDLPSLCALTGTSLDPNEVYSEALLAWHAGFSSGGWNAGLSQFFINGYLQEDILPKVDRASMMNGIEARSPFLDIDLVNFIRRLPERFRYRNGVSKWILRHAMHQKIPTHSLLRSKKGFGLPIGRWFRDRLLDFPENPQLQYLSTPEIMRLISSHRSGKTDERQSLWNLWLLNHWQGGS